jgi:hypothetical protein
MTGDDLLYAFRRAAVLIRYWALRSHPVLRRQRRRAAAKYGRLR